MPILDEDMADQYGILHTQGKFPGRYPKKYSKKIHVLIEDTGSKYLLDYGCGKGHSYTRKQVHMQWGVPRPTLYDPYYLPFSRRPKGKFDGVICTDVMEHIPEKDVDDVLADIFGYANKFVFLSIDTKPAKKELPNGKNAHCTVKPEQWWLDIISKHRPSGVEMHIEFAENE
jgi:hypothetical protein